jgi:beta-glucosidase
VPRSVGHLPVYYNYKPTAKRGYAFDKTDALFPFGFGLSYTEFTYGDLQLSKKTIAANEAIEVSATITNSGNYAGDEVVQLYVNDLMASVVQPVKLLKGFKRISLQPKQSVRVTFTLSANQLAFYDRQMKYVVEPGDIKVMLGSSSADIRLQDQFEITGKTTDVSKSKVYLTPVAVK